MACAPHSGAFQQVRTNFYDRRREGMGVVSECCVRRRARRGTHLDHVGPESVAVADLVHVPLEVHVKELHDKVQLRVAVHNVEEPVGRPRCVSGWAARPNQAREADPTTFSSFISLSSEISLIAVLGTPSSSASSRIFLSATISPVSLLRERYCRAARVSDRSEFAAYPGRSGSGSDTYDDTVRSWRAQGQARTRARTGSMFSEARHGLGRASGEHEGRGCSPSPTFSNRSYLSRLIVSGCGEGDGRARGSRM